MIIFYQKHIKTHWPGSHPPVAAVNDPETRIGRPRQVYTGAVSRDYEDISER